MIKQDGNAIHFSVDLTAGVNDKEPNSSFPNGDGNGCFWAGYEQARSANHRYIFVPTTFYVSELTPLLAKSKNALDYSNWVMVRFCFNVSQIIPSSQAKFKIGKVTNVDKNTDPNNIKWNTVTFNFNKAQIKEVKKEGDWYRIIIPSTYWGEWNKIVSESGNFPTMAICENGTSNFAKIYGHIASGTDKRPWCQIFYMNWPDYARLVSEDNDNGTINIEWEANFENDAFFSKYNIKSYYNVGSQESSRGYDVTTQKRKKYIVHEVIEDFEGSGLQGSYELSSEYKKSGQYSIYMSTNWTVYKTYNKNLSNIPEDYRVSLWALRNFTTNKPVIRVQFHTNDSNYFYADFNVTRSGWQKIAVKKRDFIKYGNPSWSNITQLKITNRNVTDGGICYIDYLIWEREATDADQTNNNAIASEWVRRATINPPNGVTSTIYVNSVYSYLDNGNPTSVQCPFSASFNYTAKFPVKNLSASIQGNNVTLSWTAPSANYGLNPAKYIVYRKKETEQNFVKIGETTATSFTDYNVTGRYFYQVAAYYDKIAQESDRKQVEAFIDTPPTVTLNSPTNNSVVNPNNIPIKFTFTDPDLNDSPSSLIIQYKEETSNWTTLTISRNNITRNADGTYSSSFSGLSPGKSYRLRIAAYDTLGPKLSNYTNEITIHANAKPNIHNFLPANNEYFNETTKTISFVFSDPTFDDYCSQIHYQLLDKNRNLISENTVSPKENRPKNEERASFDISFPESGKKYILRIRAKDAYDHPNLSWSDWKELTYYVFYKTNTKTYTYLKPVITAVSPQRADSDEVVTITGNHFGDKQNHTELRYLCKNDGNSIGDFELNVLSWSNNMITFKAPKSKEYAKYEGISDLTPFPYLTSQECNHNNLSIVPRPGNSNDYVIDSNGNKVITYAKFSLNAMSASLHPQSPVNVYDVGTNQLITINLNPTGKYSFGPHWLYNNFDYSKATGTYVGDDNERINELDEEKRKKHERAVYFEELMKIGDSESIIPLGLKSAQIFSPYSQGWTKDKLVVYVPENAGAIDKSGNNHSLNKTRFYFYSPWSKEPQTATIELNVKAPYFNQKVIDEETGVETKPFLYFGEICRLTGKYFGDRQGQSELWLTIAGKRVLLDKQVTFTNEAIYFLFGGFDLGQFKGQVPQGNGIVTLKKYFYDEKTETKVLRYECSVEVECWDSPESRKAFIQSILDEQRRKGEGEDETTYGLTIPPGGGGEAQKSLRIVNGDISFLRSGRLEFITRRPKLLQDLLIAILTPLGIDPYHPEFGCKQSFVVGETIMDSQQLEYEIRAEIVRIINDYINRQIAQLKWKNSISQKKGKKYLVWDVEEIKGIRSIDVKLVNDTIYIKISLITTREDLEIKAKTRLNL